ncbi:MAG: hypothetical protein BWY62_01396 [Firmicutes bacterium ADurb.Bin356]|nr:MAG: hypothetical protein BWY62_01396 [Firmicutes bacterium ADurb.Bin356]
MQSSELLSKLIIVCPMLFLAGFADSIAGGGGVISLPAFVFAGLPLHMAYGTNKFSMSLGTSVSAYKYYKAGHLRLGAALFAVGGALIGAGIGASLALLVSEKYLSYILMVLLPVAAVFIMANRRFGESETTREISKRKEYALSSLVGLFVGAYDGFFGPGAGMFYTLLFASLLGYSLLSASANARVVNLASNVGALFAFVSGGKVLYAIGIPAAACTILGNYLGARLAIKNGARFIRPVMVAVIVLLILKLAADYIFIA